MQMNYESATLSEQALPLLVPTQNGPMPARRQRPSFSKTTCSLTAARLAEVRMSSVEKAVWLALALISLASIAASFWI